MALLSVHTPGGPSSDKYNNVYNAVHAHDAAGASAGDPGTSSPYLCLRYQAHINVEICASALAAKYLFKHV